MTVWNASDKAASVTITGSGLVATQSGGAGSSMVRADISSASGNSDNWQFEITIGANTVGSGGSPVAIGLSNPSQNVNVDFDGVNSIGYYANGWFQGPGVASNTGTTYTTGDVIGVRKNSSGINFYKNGTTITAWATLPSGNLFPSAIVFFTGDSLTANFGATTFAHPVTGADPWVVDPTTLPARSIVVSQTLPSIFQVASMYTGAEPPAPIVGTGGYFPDTIAAVMAGRTVRCDLLVEFDFLSGPMNVWQGFGTLHTNNNVDWMGIGQLGQVSDIEAAIGGTAPQARFVLSGVDPGIVAKAMDEANEVSNRDCNVYMQFFNADFTCLDYPWVIWAGTMDVMRIKQTAQDCQVELTAETVFARRSLPPLGTLTDREQQKLFPGDNGLTYIPSLMSKTAIWPVILPQA